MKAVTFSLIPVKGKKDPVSLVIDGVKLGDRPHVVSDEILEQLLKSPFGKHVTEVRDVEPKTYQGQDLRQKHLLISRTGGFGDILFITPVIRELRRKWPACRIEFACPRQYQMIFEGNPDVQRIHGLPFPLEVYEQADYHLEFRGTIEESTDPNLHAVDLFAKHAGLNLMPGGKAPIYTPAPARVAAIRLRLIQFGIPADLPWIAVQAQSSSPIRSYPEHFTTKILKKIVKQGCVALVLGTKGNFPKGARMRGVFDLTGRLAMKDSVAALANCAALIGPDSSLVHFAGAMRLPTVALYGPFPGKVRTLYYNRCITLEAQASCAPCFIHGHKPCDKALGRKQTWSPCFETLPPSLVMQALQEALTRWGSMKRMSA